MGIGDWGLGIGDWGLGPIPNPQSPIPNPQSPFKIDYTLLQNQNNRQIISNTNYQNLKNNLDKIPEYLEKLFLLIVKLLMNKIF